MADIKIFPEWAREWAGKRLNGQDVSNADIISVKDWLNSYSKENPKIINKIMKLTWDDAMLAQQKWHQSLFKKSQKLKKYKGNPYDIKEIMKGRNGSTWNYITSKEGLVFEGEVMGHCVGGYTYKDKNIITLRDKNNIPHVTIEIEGDRIVQIQGKGNSPIHAKYSDDISDLINRFSFVLDDLNIKGINIIKNHTKNTYIFNTIDNIAKYIEDNIDDDLSFVSATELTYDAEFRINLPYVEYDDYEDDYETVDISSIVSDKIANKMLSMGLSNLYLKSNDFVEKLNSDNMRIKKVTFFKGIYEEHLDFLNKLKKIHDLKANVVNYVEDSKYILPKIQNENINIEFNLSDSLNCKTIQIKMKDVIVDSVSFKDVSASSKINMIILNSKFNDLNLLKIDNLNIKFDSVRINKLRIKNLNLFHYNDFYLNNLYMGNQTNNNQYVLFYSNTEGKLQSVSYEEYKSKVADIRKSRGNINMLELFPENTRLLWSDINKNIFKIPDNTTVAPFVGTKNISAIGNNVTFETELRLTKKITSVGSGLKAKHFVISDERFLDLNIEGEDLSVEHVDNATINDNLKFHEIALVKCKNVTVNNSTCKNLKISHAENINLYNSKPNYVFVRTKEKIKGDSIVLPENSESTALNFFDQTSQYEPDINTSSSPVLTK